MSAESRGTSTLERSVIDESKESPTVLILSKELEDQKCYHTGRCGHRKDQARDD